MARRAAPKKAKRAAPKKAKRAAPKKAAASRPTDALLYVKWRETTTSAKNQFGHGLLTAIRKSMRTTDEILVDAYLGWHIGRHPEVEPYADEEYRIAGYRGMDARRYCDWLASSATREEKQYSRRPLDVMIAVIEQLDARWTPKPLVPTAQQVTDAIRKYGGPDDATRGLYKQWLQTRAEATRRRTEHNQRERLRIVGLDAEAYAAEQQSARLNDMATRERTDWQAYCVYALEHGETVPAIDGAGIYVMTTRGLVKLNRELQRLYVGYSRVRASRKAGR